MTLLASERSILIRNKFRSVLQLRIQNRRQQNEINSEAGLKTTCAAKVGEKDSINSTRRASDGATQKSPPSGQTAETTQDRGGIGVQRQKKARLTENLTEKTEQRPGPVEFLHKRILPLENTVTVSYPLSSDVFEDDVSSCASSSPEQLGIHQSPCFSSSPGLAADQSLSELSPVATPLSHSPKNLQCSLALLPATEGISQPMSMSVAESNSMATTGRPKGIYVPSQATPLLPKTAQPQTPPPHPILGQSLASPRPPRPRKPRDSKPKMRKLKYHQYIPPDQRGGPGGGATNNSQRNNNPTPPIDSAYSRLLQQQQVFLQLQILNQQQQLTVATSGENQLVRLSPGTSPQSCPQAVPTPTNSTSVDASPTHKPELLPPNLDELTVSELRQQLRKRGLPVSGTKPALLERLRPFQMPRPHVSPVPLCQLDSSTANLPPTPPNSDTPTNPVNVFIQPMGMCEQGVAGYQTPPSSSSSSSPGLPEGSPLGCSATWRPEQATEELSVELKMRERMKNRSRERAHESANQTCGASLHPFLQQEPGCSVGKTETERQEMLFPQVFSCHDVIGHDFELPMQITASPVQSSSSVRSLEEELQEAIQRVQMDPSQSIEDILEDSISGPEEVPTVTDLHSGVAALSGPSPSPQSDQSQPQRHSKDENFLSSPLCSSLLLELPPSPSNGLPLAPALPPPPPPPICTTPPPSSTASRKRRAVVTFDPADWLESLTSGLRPLTPPAAPFMETDFGLDSDLNVNRVLDLMVEQW